MTPLFSIITVTYNAAGTIGRTLDSVASQTCTDYEHIVVDGLSADSTVALAQGAPHRQRMRIVSEKDRGLYDAMNKGLGLARGKYVVFLNAGDRFHRSDTLALYARHIAENGEPGIVYGQTQLVDIHGNCLSPRHLTAPSMLSHNDFAQGMLVCHQAFVALRRIAPLYDLRWRFSADYEWCIRCLMHSRHNVYAGSVTVDYLAEGLTTANRRKSLYERFRIMCIYYGTVPTVLRHVKFFIRNLRRR